MLAGLPLLFIGTAISFAILLIVVRLIRPEFGYSWLITAIGALIVWTLILISRLNLPQTVALNIWSMPGFPSTRAVLILDGVSWPFAFSLGTILLAVVLTDIARAQESDWSAWTASLSLTALGLLAVLAGNLLTLILAWAALDFAELMVLFWHVRRREERRRVALTVLGKVTSLFILIWAWILAGQFGSTPTFSDLPGRASFYILLAAWVRVGVVPLYTPQMQEQSVQRVLGTLLRLISAAVVLVLFVRASRFGIAEWQEPYIFALAGIAALIGGFSWIFSKDEITRHAYWIIGIAALVMGSAVSGDEKASMAWGLTGLLSGGLLFLYSMHGRWLVILPALGLIQMTCLPLTQSWNGVALYTSARPIISLIFLISQALLLAGYYIRHQYMEHVKPKAERWVVVIYIWGLGVIALVQILLAFWGNISSGTWVTPVNLATLAPGVAASGLMVFIILLHRRGYSISARNVSGLGPVLSLKWLPALVGRAVDLLGKGIALATLVLEGEGGILWALLWLILLLALVAQGIMKGV